MGAPLQHPKVQFTLPALFLGLARHNELAVDLHALGAVADLVAVVVDVEEVGVEKGDVAPVAREFHDVLYHAVFIGNKLGQWPPGWDTLARLNNASWWIQQPMGRIIMGLAANERD